jgi:hypothetical protein
MPVIARGPGNVTADSRSLTGITGDAGTGSQCPVSSSLASFGLK